MFMSMQCALTHRKSMCVLKPQNLPQKPTSRQQKKTYLKARLVSLIVSNFQYLKFRQYLYQYLHDHTFFLDKQHQNIALIVQYATAIQN